MNKKRNLPKTIDEYIDGFVPETRAILQAIRETIQNAAPNAAETISYQMPAFRQHGVLIYFAAWKKHIGLYPPITENTALQKSAARYAGEKGNLQFPLDHPIPYTLVARIVKHRLKQDAETKKRKKK